MRLPNNYFVRVAGPCFLVCHGAILVNTCYNEESANHAAWKHYHSIGHMEQCTKPLASMAGP